MILLDDVLSGFVARRKNVMSPLQLLQLPQTPSAVCNQQRCHEPDTLCDAADEDACKQCHALVSIWWVPCCVHFVTTGAYAGSARRLADDVARRQEVFNSCGSDLFTRIDIGTMVGMALLYFVATCALIFWKLNRHKSMHYRQIQVGTVFFRLQVSSAGLTGQLCC